jgi:hypothetical protein
MEESMVQDLRSKLGGELITPADVGYETARKVYNGMIDRRPALIARCRDAAGPGRVPWGRWPRRQRPPARRRCPSSVRDMRGTPRCHRTELPVALHGPRP